ncbi:MAG TPA: hypothetical protein VF773_15410 [Verrucomicrobiae bacterium]
MGVKRFIGYSAAVCCAVLSTAFAQEKESTTEAAKTAKAIPSQAELEKKFKELLTDCVFDGHWCMVRDGKLTEEKSEKYTIASATKSGGDVWLIYAKMQYRGKEMTIPVPIQLKWAGDTPVITLDNVNVGGGTYSARVLVYDKTYAGTWSAGDHGGMLHGMVTKKEKAEAAQ